MKCEYKYDQSNKLITIKIMGIYSPKSTGENIKKIFSEIKSYKYDKVLFDLRDADFKYEIMTAYKRPSTFLKVGFDRSKSYAYVVKEIKADVGFLETVMVNNGFQFIVLTDYDKAYKWLIPEDQIGLESETG